MLWKKCYGGSNIDAISCAKQTADGGYIAAGNTFSTDGDPAGNGGITGLWVIKLDAAGNILWEKTYNDTIRGGTYIESLADGSYILTGDKTIKLHSDGSIDWVTNIGGVVVHQASDGGYIVGDLSDPELSKLHPDGSIDWRQNYGAAITLSDVCESDSGGYMICGYTYDIYNSPLVIRTDALGNIVTPVVNDYSHGLGVSIIRTKDNKYIYSVNTPDSLKLFKIDDTLASYWAVPLVPGATGGRLALTADNGFVTGGSDTSFPANMAIVKFDTAGRQLWKRVLGGSLQDVCNSALQAVNGDYIMAGFTSSSDGDVIGNHGSVDGWIVALKSSLSVNDVLTAAPDVRLYPMPAKGQLSVDLPVGYEHAVLQLTDISGKAIPIKEDGSLLSRTLHMRQLPAGQYQLTVISKDEVKTYKISHY